MRLRPVLLSLHRQRQALAVAVELRRIHALDLGDAGLVLAAKLDARRILEDVGALGQVINEEVARHVAGALVIGQAILILVAR